MKYYAPTRISDNMHVTPEGFLLCIGVPIARTGEMEYGKGETPLEVGDDGKVYITRSAEDVFSPKTMASFEGKAFTIKHPEDFIDPDNWAFLSKGHMQNVRKGEGEFADSLIADVLIQDAFAISLVKSGLRGLSCGYEAEYTQTGPGRGTQTNIVGNHLALVEEGRAGSAYEIRDHKGVSSMGKTKKSFADKVKEALFKVVDEAAAESEKDDAKDDSEEMAPGMDGLMKAVKDLGEKVDAMAKGKASKDEPEPKPAPKKEDAAKDDDEESPAESTMEDRMAALEAAVQKILEKMSGESEDDSEVIADEDEDSDEAGDEGEETDDEDEDGKSKGKAMDTASRAEILAPGIKSSKDIKSKALKLAYGTKDGKAVIDSLTGGKPNFAKDEQVELLFTAASELLKKERAGDLSRTVRTTDFKPTISREGGMTAEKMNEINEKIYANK